MEVTDCLQMMIALLSGKFELVRAWSELNTVLKQKHFYPSFQLRISNRQTHKLVPVPLRGFQLRKQINLFSGQNVLFLYGKGLLPLRYLALRAESKDL